MQPEEEAKSKTGARPKPDISRELYFDCFLEKGTYEKAGFEPMDCEDIICHEKGRDKYDGMIKNRKDAFEARR